MTKIRNIPINFFNQNAAKNLIDLEKNLGLDRVKILNQQIDLYNKTHVYDYPYFNNLKSAHAHDFAQLGKITPLSPKFTSSMHPLSAIIDFTRDYRNFKSLSQFTDANIEYNIQVQCFSSSLLTLHKVHKLKLCLYDRLVQYRNACLSGDEHLIAILDSEKYQKGNSNSDTDEFNSFEFQMKKQLYEIAQNEKRFSNITSTLTTFNMQQKAGLRKTPDNVYVEKKLVNTPGKSCYKNVQEIAIASTVSADYPNYLYYVTCDRPKSDIIKILNNSGYQEVGFCPQACPDLVIIDYHRKIYIFFDIKNCMISNVRKYLADQDQFLVFFGHLSQPDRIAFIQMYTSRQIRSLNNIINDSSQPINVRNEARKVYNDILNANLTPEEIFNIDPFITGTSNIASTDNDINFIDPTIFN